MSAQLSLKLTYAFLAFRFFSNLGVTAELTIPANGSFFVPSSATMQMGCADLNAGGSTLLNAGQIQQAGNVSIAASGSLNAGSGSLQVGGNWTNNGTFVAGTSSVSFVSGCSNSNATISGTTTFNNLTLTSTAARTFLIESGHYTTVNGTLNISGSPGPVTLAPSTGSTAYIALGPNAVYTSSNANVPSSVQIGNSGGGGGGGGSGGGSDGGQPASSAPGAPLNPYASAGNAQVLVTWTAPNTGGAPVSYLVTSQPDGATCSSLVPATTCSVLGLRNGTAYSFTVIASNSYGSSPASANSNTVVPVEGGSGDGICGPATGVSTLTPPASPLLCGVGAASSVIAEAGYFNWSCSAVGSGIQANCVAPGALTETRSSRVTLEIPDCLIAEASLSPIDGQPPVGIQFPYGAVKFKATRCSEDPIKPRLTYSSALDEMNYWELINNTWIEAYKTELSGYAIPLLLQDNGQYDADPEVGVISNNAGPASSNNKKAQRPLVLFAKSLTIKAGQNLSLRLTGGQGRGRAVFDVHATGGAQCRVTGNTLRTRGIYSGTCIVRAIKKADKSFNATSSNPVIINVVGAAAANQ